MPFIVLPGGDDVVIGLNIPREKRGIDVMAQLKASVLKADGREDIPEMEITTGPAGDLNAGAVLRSTMAITVSGPGGDVPDYVTMMSHGCCCLIDP